MVMYMQIIGWVGRFHNITIAFHCWSSSNPFSVKIILNRAILNITKSLQLQNFIWYCNVFNINDDQIKLKDDFLLPTPTKKLKSCSYPVILSTFLTVEIFSLCHHTKHKVRTYIYLHIYRNGTTWFVSGVESGILIT